MKKVRRNGPCPCGSGEKTKKCCLNKIRDFQHRISEGESPQSIIVSNMMASAQPEPEQEEA